MAYRYEEIGQFLNVSEFIHKVDEMKESATWPFSVVSPDNIFSAYQGVDYALSSATVRRDGRKTTPIEVVFDKSTITLQMLKIQVAMEKEVAYEKAGGCSEKRLAEMETIIKAFNVAKYTIDDRIAIRMESELEEKGFRYQYLDFKENSGEELLGHCIDSVQAIANRHFYAMQDAYSNMDKIIDVGLPEETNAEHVMNKLYDRITSKETHAQKNSCQRIVCNLIKAEQNIEFVTQYILPKLDIEVAKATDLARMEKENNMRAGQSDNYQKESLKNILYIRSETIKILEKMREEEAKLKKDNRSIEIDKSGNHRKWKVQFQRNNGGKTIDEKPQKDTKTLGLELAGKTTVTHKRGYAEQNRAVEVGAQSGGTYTDNYRGEYTGLEDSVKSGVYGKRKHENGVGLEAGYKAMSGEIESKSETRLNGKRKRKLSASFKVFEAGFSAFVRRFKKDFDIVKFKAGVLDMGAEFEQRGWFFAAKIHAKIFGVKGGGIEDLLNDEFNFGSVSLKGDSQSFLNSVVEELKNEMSGDFLYMEYEAVGDNIKDKIVEVDHSLLDNTINYGGIEMHKVELSHPGGDIEVENSFQQYTDIAAGERDLTPEDIKMSDIAGVLQWAEGVADKIVNNDPYDHSAHQFGGYYERSINPLISELTKDDEMEFNEAVDEDYEYDIGR